MTDPAPHDRIPVHPEALPSAGLNVDEIRARSLRGAKLVVARGVVVKAIVFLGSLMLARLLGPTEFGLIAVGLTAMAFAQLLADGGLAAGLIRRPEEPTRLELQNIVGWQLVITGLAAAGGLVVGSLTGRTGMLVGLMLLALPLATLQVPGAVTLERALRFGPRVVVELVEALVWAVVAVGSVAAGAGVWGIAVATIAKPASGAVAMFIVAPVGLVRPRLQWAVVRDLVGFGVRFQVVGAVNLARDQGLNLLVLALGGYVALGLWSLALRLMQLPYLVLDSLWRVSFPAMSRLVAAGHDMVPLLRVCLRVVAAGTGTVLVALAAAGPRLVPAVFGEEWTPAGSVIAPACAGLLLAGPVSVTAAGYLYAAGKTRVIIWAALLHTVAWLVGTALLWPAVGLTSIGWGWLASAVIEAAMLARALRQEVGLRVGSHLVRPLACGLLAGVAGTAAAGVPGGDFIGAVVGATVAVSGFLLLMFMADRAALRQLREVLA